jgi:16S rRNA (cytosine1402-N4)-methyltransferase
MLPSVLPTETDHVPVLAEEVVTNLDPRPGETVVDATFGAGGHAALLARRLRGDGRLIAIDRDPTVAPFFDRFRREHGIKARLHHGEFSAVLQHLAANAVQADVILLDLGVSSMQIDRPERGFSYAVDAPLDMRMDPSATTSAEDVVNDSSERDLADIFKRLGEERYARQIARAIAKRRRERPFERTGDLVDVIKAAIPAPARFGEGHPAKRVFQALRIEVNDELAALQRALPAALEMLRPGGRLGVISFHSLEDRIVKQFLRREEQGCTCPPDFPVCICGSKPSMRATPRRAIRPTAAEIARNPRAQSARLRVGTRV